MVVVIRKMRSLVGGVRIFGCWWFPCGTSTVDRCKPSNPVRAMANAVSGRAVRTVLLRISGSILRKIVWELTLFVEIQSFNATLNPVEKGSYENMTQSKIKTFIM